MKLTTNPIVKDLTKELNFKKEASLVILLVFTGVTAIIAIHNFTINSMVDFYITVSIVLFNLLLYWYLIKFNNTLVVGTIIFWMMALVSLFLAYEHHFNSVVVFLILSPLIAFLLLPIKLATFYLILFELMAAYLFYWGYQHYGEENKLIFSLNGMLDYIFATLYLIVFWLYYHYVINKSMQTVQKLYKDKTMLLQELHHRVKNNFNLMTSLLKMQYEHADKLNTQDFVNSFQNRVESIVLAHELLYVESVSQDVLLSEYIPQLTKHIKQGCIQECIVDIDYNIEPLHMPIDSVIYLGIIINELLINSLKYAFKDCKGRIKIVIKQLESSRYLLEYSDNGQGLGKENKTGFGSLIIKLASTQLKGNLERSSSNSGLYYKIEYTG